MSELYPPSVAAAQVELSASIAHRRGAVRLLLGLIGFAVVYLGLLIGCVAAPVVLIDLALREPALWLVAGPGVLLFALLTFVLVRNLVHRAGVSAAGIEVTAVEQPRLFAFLERLAADAGAPMPDRVKLIAGVNAAMLRSASVIGLVFGGRRELVLGLGLINVLDLGELKAVLAHELGHFAQSSARLGQWAHRTTVLLREIVGGRDRFDDRLARARASRSLLVRGFAALLSVGVRGVRRLLGRLLERIVRADLALAREMEFNADLHAVALCGSDAIVAALWRAQRGALALRGAASALRELGKHGVFSDDLYRHHDARLAELDERTATSQDPMIVALRTPYRPGPALHFPAGEAPAEVMWYSHPSYREREINAKRRYVASAAGLDEGRASAWALFDDHRALRRRATTSFYEHLGYLVDDGQLRDAAEVERRIADELAEREQGAHYFGFYQNRLIEIADLDALLAEAEADDDDDDALVEAWRGEALAAFMQRWRATEAELDRIREAIRAGEELDAARARQAVLEAERDAQRREAERGDRAVFRWLWRQAAPEVRVELERRLRFLSFVQAQIVTLNRHRDRVMPMFASRDPSGPPVELLAALDALHRDLDALLSAAEALELPSLRNLDGGSTRAFLLPDPLVPAHDDEPLREWLGRFMPQVTRVHDRLRTLHYKNLGALLALRDRIEGAAQGLRGNSSRT